MDIKLVFCDWEKEGKSIYSTEEGIELSSGSFHSGTTFNGTISLDEEEKEELERAIKSGATPKFYIVK